MAEVTKADVLAAVRRCAEENGGKPLGLERFIAATGLTEMMWLGRYWVKWNDLVTEAGFAPGAMNAALPAEEVMASLATLVRDLGRYPTAPELRMRRHQDPSFPSPNVFGRFGGKADVAARLIEHCAGREELADVVALAEPVAEGGRAAASSEDEDAPTPGEVYLMISGSHYKLGRSNSTGRRAYELAIQLPERLDLVHSIETDDAAGIEAYWHRRFAARRLNGDGSL